MELDSLGSNPLRDLGYCVRRLDTSREVLAVGGPVQITEEARVPVFLRLMQPVPPAPGSADEGLCSVSAFERAVETEWFNVLPAMPGGRRHPFGLLLAVPVADPGDQRGEYWTVSA